MDIRGLAVEDKVVRVDWKFPSAPTWDFHFVPTNQYPEMYPCAVLACQHISLTMALSFFTQTFLYGCGSLSWKRRETIAILHTQHWIVERRPETWHTDTRSLLCAAVEFFMGRQCLGAKSVDPKVHSTILMTCPPWFLSVLKGKWAQETYPKRMELVQQS